jgi:tetratricopeptide (TPR) repeat protein
LEQLVADDPRELKHLERLAINHNEQGAFYSSQNHLQDAAEQFLRSVAWRERALELRPDNRVLRRHLAGTCVNLSSMYQQLQHRERAREFHDRANVELCRLLESDPQDFDTLHNLAVLRVNRASTLIAEKQVKAALADLDKSVPLLEAALLREPNLATLRDALYRTLGVRAQCLRHLKRHAEAAAAWLRVAELGPPEWRTTSRVQSVIELVDTEDFAKAAAEAERVAKELTAQDDPTLWFFLAQAPAAAAGHDAADAGLPAEQRQARADRYARTALDWLATCKQRSKPEQWQERLNSLKTEGAFAALRGRPEYQQLLKP